VPWPRKHRQPMRSSCTPNGTSRSATGGGLARDARLVHRGACSSGAGVAPVRGDSLPSVPWPRSADKRGRTTHNPPGAGDQRRSRTARRRFTRAPLLSTALPFTMTTSLPIFCRRFITRLETRTLTVALPAFFSRTLARPST
jgi:hypothetical protein